MIRQRAFGPLLLAILGLTTLSEIAVGALVYGRLRQQLEGDLARRLVHVSTLLALDVDPALVVQFHEGDESLAAYQRVRDRLALRARAAGLERAYVVDAGLRVRVDSDPAQAPGRVRSALLANRSEAEHAAAGDATATRLYPDEHGRLHLSALAPLRASDGSVVALV